MVWTVWPYIIRQKIIAHRSGERSVYTLINQRREPMPVKFKESETVYNTTTRKRQSQKHFYMHTTPTKELVDYMSNRNATPKGKQKVANELVKRGVLK